MKAKAKGNRNERKAKAILEQAGYVCTKSGASLGVFDVIAENPLGIRHIQVKSNRIPEPVEREAMVNMRKQLPVNSTVEFWVFYDGNTTKRVEYL
jgi:Holliday junction resolvase-like predicted endonuclease